MESAVSYTITEAAEVLKLSAKTIRRYIKAGKLPSVKVMTKFGEEYRITEIPEALRQEAEAQAQAQAKVDLVIAEKKPESTLDAQTLYQENIRLAAQLGAATERIRQLEDKLKLLEAPKEASSATQRPWWKRLLSIK
jgi:MerR family copper efflux transcriptional regulator